MDGCLVYTTAEIVIGVFDGAEFQRVFDQQSGSKELQVVPRQYTPER